MQKLGILKPEKDESLEHNHKCSWLFGINCKYFPTPDSLILLSLLYKHLLWFMWQSHMLCFTFSVALNNLRRNGLCPRQHFYWPGHFIIYTSKMGPSRFLFIFLIIMDYGEFVVFWRLTLFCAFLKIQWHCTARLCLLSHHIHVQQKPIIIKNRGKKTQIGADYQILIKG